MWLDLFLSNFDELCFLISLDCILTMFVVATNNGNYYEFSC